MLGFGVALVSLAVSFFLDCFGSWITVLRSLAVSCGHCSASVLGFGVVLAPLAVSCVLDWLGIWITVLRPLAVSCNHGSVVLD